MIKHRRQDRATATDACQPLLPLTVALCITQAAQAAEVGDGGAIWRWLPMSLQLIVFVLSFWICLTWFFTRLLLQDWWPQRALGRSLSLFLAVNVLAALAIWWGRLSLDSTSTDSWISTHRYQLILVIVGVAMVVGTEVLARTSRRR